MSASRLLFRDPSTTHRKGSQTSVVGGPVKGRGFHCGAAVAVLFLLFLPACTVGPDYHRPGTPAPAQWVEQPGPGIGIDTEPVTATEWWRLFHDDKLNSLIETAVQSNFDLRVARARVREARALRIIAGGEALPQVDAAGSYARQRQSENAPGSSSNGDHDLFQAGFDATWEWDVFGRLRRSVEAADADVQASEENRRDVLVSLLGEIGTTYVQLRGNQLRLAFARENITTQTETVTLTRGRFEAGLGNLLEVAQAETLLASIEARIPGLEADAYQAVHGLEVLCALPPGTLKERLLDRNPIPSPPPEIPIGLPSELLRRRPDIRRAERELAAATARIGVATADLFPRFSLTGSLGLESLELSDLLSAGSRFWSLGPGVGWPVFDAGRARANVEVYNARQEEALALYEKTVLASFRDVEDALVAYAKERETRGALQKAVEASRTAADIARELYTKGLVDFLNVLQSQSSLYEAEDQLAQSEQRLADALITLFKSLGGGWEVLDPQSPNP